MGKRKHDLVDKRIKGSCEKEGYVNDILKKKASGENTKGQR